MNTPSPPSLNSWLRSVSQVAAILVTCIGSLALVGWIFDIALLKSVLPGLVTMKANTAIGFIVGGVSLCSWHTQQMLVRRSRDRLRLSYLSMGLSAIVFAIGLLTLVQYIHGFNFGIDELFFKDDLDAIGTSAPGRMAPNSALNFLIVGLAGMILAGNHWKTQVYQLLSLSAFLVAFLGFLGYAYQVKTLYGISSYTQMALHTAIAFMLYSVGLLFAQSDRGLMAVFTIDNAGGLMARRLAPAAIAIPPFLGALILFGYRQRAYDTEIGLSLLAVLNIVVFAVLTWWNAKSLSRLDIKRQRAEAQSRIDAQAAAQALAHLSAIVDNLADGLLVIDLNGRVARFNPALVKMFGLQEQDLTGKDCESVFKGQLIDLVGEIQKNPKQVLTAEIALVHGHWGQASIAGIVTADDLHGAQCLGSVMLIRDVTAEKQVDRMKTDFISTVSHELRTPLTSVLGFTKIIQKKLEDNIFPLVTVEDRKVKRTIRQVGDNIEIILSEGQRLTALINDVLDIAKMEAGKIEWHLETLDLGEIARRAILTTTSLFESKGIVCEADIPENLPPIVADRHRLLQVFINLISNAVKFTDRGSVTCRLRQEGDRLVVRIVDTGIGIAPDDLEKVFEKFKQVGETLTDKPKGTGLGLPICKQIIEYHGGEIGVESELGCGSTFFFSLPLAVAESERTQKLDLDLLLRQLKDRALPAPDRDTAVKTILVVDDDPSIREYLRQELVAEGYQVCQAKDGIEAIEQAKALHPHLIVLDVMMPKMNGFDVAAVLKNDPQTMDIPIVILSILEDKERGFRIGIDRYLTKPVDPESLIEAIGSLLSLGSSRKKVLIVDEDVSTLKTLTKVLVARGYSVVEASNEVECIEQAIRVRPDMIVVDSCLSEQHNIVQTLRLEKGLENVFFLLLSQQANAIAGDSRVE
ncbi:response regulator [Oxynema sp. CENA135]|uniref:response regulator n=1 Tax=Oxynema sp. CENA135 TaxID=984206 RepID=UPI00190D7AD7|nr:response regulator [Oxynema sp. CENA135]MBK4730890.1 response regulator [Oxynema sp. CENA135]